MLPTLLSSRGFGLGKWGQELLAGDTGLGCPEKGPISPREQHSGRRRQLWVRALCLARLSLWEERGLSQSCGPVGYGDKEKEQPVP